MFREGVAIDNTGKKLSGSVKKGSISLWHPVSKDIEEVEAWRELMFQLQVAQPFKQAFREVYVVTDAERETELYSNRFAAHVIFQPKFAALAAQRGWGFNMIGGSGEYGMHNNAEKQSDQIQATFCVQETATDHLTPHHFYEYLATDQVQFSVGQERMKVEDVPALVFSELMRDIDLFVGTCSIATDPEWEDSGIDGYQGVWENTAFGELTATADTRKSALERLLPTLTIADNCELKGRFLHVSGTQRNYKIHLGSGNILMTPNDEYLCFLPFQEDYMLSLILSKAFLLANDDKIKDPSIISQIEMKKAS